MSCDLSSSHPDHFEDQIQGKHVFTMGKYYCGSCPEVTGGSTEKDLVTTSCMMCKKIFPNEDWLIRHHVFEHNWLVVVGFFCPHCNQLSSQGPQFTHEVEIPHEGFEKVLLEQCINKYPDDKFKSELDAFKKLKDHNLYVLKILGRQKQPVVENQEMEDPSTQDVFPVRPENLECQLKCPTFSGGESEIKWIRSSCIICVETYTGEWFNFRHVVSKHYDQVKNGGYCTCCNQFADRKNYTCHTIDVPRDMFTEVTPEECIRRSPDFDEKLSTLENSENPPMLVVEFAKLHLNQKSRDIPKYEEDDSFCSEEDSYTNEVEVERLQETSEDSMRLKHDDSSSILVRATPEELMGKEYEDENSTFARDTTEEPVESGGSCSTFVPETPEELMGQ